MQDHKALHYPVHYLVVKLGDAVDGEVLGPGHEPFLSWLAAVPVAVPLVDDLHTPCAYQEDGMARREVVRTLLGDVITVLTSHSKSHETAYDYVLLCNIRGTGVPLTEDLCRPLLEETAVLLSAFQADEDHRDEAEPGRKAVVVHPPEAAKLMGKMQGGKNSLPPS